VRWMAPPPPPLPALPGADASGADASGALDLFSSGAYRPPSDELDAMLAELLRGPPRSAQAQEAVAHVCAASAALCDGGIQPPAHSGASLLLLLIPFALGCTAGAACGLLCRRAPKRAARKQDSRTTPLDSPRTPILLFDFLELRVRLQLRLFEILKPSNMTSILTF